MLKSIVLTVLGALLLMGAAGLTPSLAAPLPQSGPRLFPYSADGQTYGYVDTAGEWVIEPTYDFAADFAEGLALVAVDGQYGFIDAGGEPVVAPQYEFAASFANGLALVAVDGLFGFIDPTGQVVIEPRFEEARSFSGNGLAAVRQAEAYGFIDQTGQLIIEPQFEFASDFAEGLAAVLVDGRYGYIDEAGQVVIEPQFDLVADFSEGLAAVLSDDRVGFIDPTGALVIDPVYDFALEFAEGLAAVTVAGQVGYIDPDGQLVIAPQFDFGESFSEGLAAVRVDEQFGYIDETGQMVIEPQFDQAGPFVDGLAPVERAHEWGRIAPDGEASFLLPVAAPSPTETHIIPFLPGVPAAVREGACLSPSAIVLGDFAWRCTLDSTEIGLITMYDPCLIAGDGQTVVCGADPLTGKPGFRVNLVEPLPAEVEPVAGENHAWLVQLADRTVCGFDAGAALTIAGQRANYTCSDGSLLLGELQPGLVWQADRAALADIKQTEAGYEADQTRTVEIDTIWQPVDVAGVFEEIGLTPADVRADIGDLADSLIAEARPAMPVDPDTTGGLTSVPAHLRFSLDGADLPDSAGVFLDKTQLLIFPIAPYEDLYQDTGLNTVGERLAALETLLEERPAIGDEEIPALSDFGEATQTLKAQVKYLDFAGGSGVRFLTHYGVGNGPITDYNTFYTFHGLTDDGKYYIAFYQPASTNLLPDDFEAVQSLLETDEATGQAYLQEIVTRLEQAPTMAFTPTLTSLDTMLESLEIGQ